MSKGPAILIVTTSHAVMGDRGESTGVWLEELATPYYAFRDAGAKVTITSVNGGAVPVDPRSTQGDQPESVRRFRADAAAMQAVESTPAIATIDDSAFDAIFLPGGHGTMWDLPESLALAASVGKFYDAGKVVAAVCHGPAGLVAARRTDGQPVVKGKRISAFTDEEERAAGLAETVPFLLESRLSELGARFEKAPPFQPFAIRDGNIITGQNPASSEKVARLVLEAMPAEAA